MLLLKIANWWYDLTQWRAQRLIHKLYPDAEERAMSLLAQGAEELEIVATGQGWVLGCVEVYPSEEGYDIAVADSIEVSSDLE